MISRADAVLRATAHLSGEPELERGYRLAHGEPIELPDAWYFDLRIEPIPTDPLDAVGGAPGFLIEKVSGELQYVSWEEYHTLELSRRLA